MRLPAQEIKSNDNERKKKRVTAVVPTLSNGEGKRSEENGKAEDIEVQRKKIVDKFSHHKRVADYLLGKSVGEGSFAKVRLGLHVQTAEEVAIKVMSKARARKDSYVHKNLRREGRILQMSRHKNVVQVYDILETDNNYYLVTEYCKGGELIDIVTEKGCLQESVVRKYMAQLVSAVSHLHDHGIVHRDLKVENLLLNDKGEIKIIDFGLSNVISSKCGDPTRALATQCGSPAYAAPELLAKNMYGPKVDVWSIGIITYALLVGKLPFTVEPFRIPKLCRKMLLGDMNPIPSHLSGNCRHFIRRLLIPDPDIRPTIAQVMKMIWINPTGRPSLNSSFGKPGAKFDHVHTSSDINMDVVREMTSQMDFEFADVLNCIRKNRPGEALATYYLLLKQTQRKRDGMERRNTDVIGSDGNLDHGNDSDLKSSDEEEEGLNDIDDVTNDVIIKDLFRKDTLYKATTEKSKSNQYGEQESVSDNYVTTADDVIQRHDEIRLSNKKKPTNGFLKVEQNSGQSESNTHDKKRDTPVRRRNTVNICETTEAQGRLSENGTGKDSEDGKHESTKNGKSSPKFPDLNVTPSDKTGSKPERKSRGPGSMRDLVRTMSRARQALQRRSMFGQKQNGKNEEKKQQENAETGRFTRLLSKNNDDMNDDSKNMKTQATNHSKPSRNLWENHLTPGEAAVLTPRVSLPDAPPAGNPLSARLSGARQWRDGRSIVPSSGYPNAAKYNPGLCSPLLSHYERTNSPHRMSSFRNRANTEDLNLTSPDTTNHILPRISIDKSGSHSEAVSSPIGGNKSNPRYHFPSPPRTPISRDSSSTGVGNGVKEMIDKFHALLNNDPTYFQNGSDVSQGPSRSRESTVAAMNYLSSNRKKREEFRNNTPKSNAQMLKQGSRGSPRSPSPYGTLRPPGYDINFASHFGGDGGGAIPPYMQKKKVPTSSDFKNPSTAIWYKSAV